MKYTWRRSIRFGQIAFLGAQLGLLGFTALQPNSGFSSSPVTAVACIETSSIPSLSDLKTSVASAVEGIEALVADAEKSFQHLKLSPRRLDGNAFIEVSDKMSLRYKALLETGLKPSSYRAITTSAKDHAVKFDMHIGLDDLFSSRTLRLPRRTLRTDLIAYRFQAATERGLGRGWFYRNLGPGLLNYFQNELPAERLDKKLKSALDLYSRTHTKFQKQAEILAEFKGEKHFWPHSTETKEKHIRLEMRSMLEALGISIEDKKLNFGAVFQHVNKSFSLAYERFDLHKFSLRPLPQAEEISSIMPVRHIWNHRDPLLLDIRESMTAEYRRRFPENAWDAEYMNALAERWKKILPEGMDGSAAVALAFYDAGSLIDGITFQQGWDRILAGLFEKVKKVSPNEDQLTQTLITIAILDSYLDFSREYLALASVKSQESKYWVERLLNSYVEVVSDIVELQGDSSRAGVMSAVLIADALKFKALEIVERDQSERASFLKTNPDFYSPTSAFGKNIEGTAEYAIRVTGEVFQSVKNNSVLWKGFLGQSVTGLNPEAQGYLKSALIKTAGLIPSKELSFEQNLFPMPIETDLFYTNFDSLGKNLKEFNFLLSSSSDFDLPKSGSTQMKLVMLYGLSRFKARGLNTDNIFPISTMLPWIRYVEFGEVPLPEPYLVNM